jgi:hypothetical protein
MGGFDQLANDRFRLSERKEFEVREHLTHMGVLENAVRDRLRDYIGRGLTITCNRNFSCRNRLLGEINSTQILLKFDWLVPKAVVIEPSARIFSDKLPLAFRRDDIKDEESDFEFLITPNSEPIVQTWAIERVGGMNPDAPPRAGVDDPGLLTGGAFSSALFDLLTIDED